MPEIRKWYALRVKVALKEKVIATLESKGVICLSPVNGPVNPPRRIISNEPGFLESLVFIKTNEQVLESIHSIKGVENFLYWRQSFAAIHEKEILLLRYFSEIKKDLFFEKIPVNPDGEVVLTTGPFLLKEGDSYDVKSKAIKAELPSLGYIIAAESDDDMADPVLVLNAQQDISFEARK
jgi:hypothetical protein